MNFFTCKISECGITAKIVKKKKNRNESNNRMEYISNENAVNATAAYFDQMRNIKFQIKR